jgi:hypothetical protein
MKGSRSELPTCLTITWSYLRFFACMFVHVFLCSDDLVPIQLVVECFRDNVVPC